MALPRARARRRASAPRPTARRAPCRSMPAGRSSTTTRSPGARPARSRPGPPCSKATETGRRLQAILLIDQIEFALVYGGGRHHQQRRRGSGAESRTRVHVALQRRAVGRQGIAVGMIDPSPPPARRSGGPGPGRWRPAPPGPGQRTFGAPTSSSSASIAEKSSRSPRSRRLGVGRVPRCPAGGASWRTECAPPPRRRPGCRPGTAAGRRHELVQFDLDLAQAQVIGATKRVSARSAGPGPAAPRPARAAPRSPRAAPAAAPGVLQRGTAWRWARVAAALLVAASVRPSRWPPGSMRDSSCSARLQGLALQLPAGARCSPPRPAAPARRPGWPVPPRPRRWPAHSGSGPAPAAGCPPQQGAAFQPRMTLDHPPGTLATACQVSAGRADAVAARLQAKRQGTGLDHRHSFSMFRPPQRGPQDAPHIIRRVLEAEGKIGQGPADHQALDHCDQHFRGPFRIKI
jgi:hypothetical protein